MLTILISSTFNDMQAERDVIQSHVAPTLRQVAAQYGKSVRLLDLRWGVNTANMSEEDAAQKVLETCLNEIDRCDGYMVCLLGNRYGWTPDYEKLLTLQSYGINITHPYSVTELEIQYGILQRNKGEKSIVFLRDEVSCLPDELFSQYNDSDDNSMISDLKAQLEALPYTTCEHYSLKYTDNGEFEGISSFAERLIEKLTTLLHKVFSEENQIGDTQILKRQFEHIVEEHYETYLPNPVLEKELSEFTEVSSSILMLQGDEGSGRTAFISRLVKNAPCNIRVIPYFCNCGYNQHSIRDILEYFINQLKHDASLDSLSQEELVGYFNEIVSRIRKPVWFAVDGMDMIIGDDDIRLSWLPQNLQKNVRFVLTSSKSDIACRQISESFDVRYCFMQPVPDTSEFIKKCLETAGKSVPDTVLDKIAEHPLSKNYLFCDMVVRMLMLLNRHDFAVMNRNSGDINAINSYILSKIESLPATMDEMTFLYLYDCGEQIMPGKAASFLSAVAQVPMGLRPQDLQALFPDIWDEAEFSYFAAYLSGFFECNDMGCYNFTYPSMKSICLRISEDGLSEKIASYFATLPDNDPIKIISALPMFILYNMYDCAESLMLANPQEKRLYKQIWRSLIDSPSEVAILMGHDRILELFLDYGIDLYEDKSALGTIADILKFRTPPENPLLHRKTLHTIARFQLEINNKKEAYQTLSLLLPLEDNPLSRAETIVLITECTFVSNKDEIKRFTELLDEALDIFKKYDSLEKQSEFLLYKGTFYRFLIYLHEAAGVSILNVRNYVKHSENTHSEESCFAYIETLIHFKLMSYTNEFGTVVFDILIKMCSLGNMLLSHISPDESLLTEYSLLFLTLIKVMNDIDSPAHPLEKNVSTEASVSFAEFRVLRDSLINMAYATVLTTLKGKYNSILLKILARLQLHIAQTTDDAKKRKKLLADSTRILQSFFSEDADHELCALLKNALSDLAVCYLEEDDKKLFKSTLKKWEIVAFTDCRKSLIYKKDQCRRFPDEIHEREMDEAHDSLINVWETYCQRLWLGKIFGLKDCIDTIISLYFSMSSKNNFLKDFDLINNAAVLLNKLFQLEKYFEKNNLSEEDEKTLNVAYSSTLKTILNIILLSEKNISETGENNSYTPQFYYRNAARFIEFYLGKCAERKISISAAKTSQLLLRLIQFRLSEAVYCPETSIESLQEVFFLSDVLSERIKDTVIPASVLFDETSTESVCRLRCQAYLMFGDIFTDKGDTKAAFNCYKKTAQLCAYLHSINNNNSALTKMILNYVKHIMPPLLEYCESFDADYEYNKLCELLSPIIDEFL